MNKCEVCVCVFMLERADEDGGFTLEIPFYSLEKVKDWY